MENSNVISQVDTIFTNMANFTQQDGLLGKPITQGDKTFLPVMSIAFGYAGGDMQSKTKTQYPTMAGSSGALGAGAKLCADAVIVIDKDNVMIAPINAQQGSLGQIINQIPQIVGTLGGKQNSQQQQQQQQGGQQQGGQQSQMS